MAGEQTGDDTGVKEDQPTFKPYKSILKFSSSSSRPRDTQDDTRVGETVVRPPPWRRPVGAAFFSYGPGPELDVIDPTKDSEYAEMMERTFAGFSDQVIGADVPVVDFRDYRSDASWGVDEAPEVPLVNGERPVLYHTADDVSAPAAGAVKHV
jgi:hypothetical protein